MRSKALQRQRRRERATMGAAEADTVTPSIDHVKPSIEDVKPVQSTQARTNIDDAAENTTSDDVMTDTGESLL